MSTIACSRRIEASPADVFAAITDLEGAARRISAITNMEVLTEGPFGVGTRWRETRIMFKRECSEEMTVVEHEPGRSYTTEAGSCGNVYRCTLLVEPDGTGAVLHMSMDATPVTFMARLLAPLSRLFSGALVKCIEGDLDDIQAHLEGRAPGAVTA